MAAVTKKKTSLGRKWLNQYQLHLFLLVPVVLVLIFKYYPMLGAQIAFRQYKVALGIWGSPWVGFKNFNKFFNSYKFGTVIKNTLTISAYSIFIGFPIPVFFALILNTVRNLKYKKFVQTLTYMPHFISTVVMVGILMQVLNPITGLYYRLYSMFGGQGYPSNLLNNADAFVHIYFWSGVWQNLGWDTIIYIAALAGVDPTLYEAAEIDGASRWKRLLHIDFPSIMPTITIMLILRCGDVMSVGFEKIYLMQNKLNLSRSEVISTYVYKLGLQSSGDFSLSAAVGLFNSVVNFVMLVLVNALSRKISKEGVSLW